MADIVGVLATSTIATTGTATLYTVPAGKTAKIKVMYRGTAGANSTLALIVNGVTVFTSAAATAGHIIYSSTALMVNDAASSGAVNGSSAALTVAPGPTEYLLSAGQVVQYTVGTANYTDLVMMVVGVELDV